MTEVENSSVLNTTAQDNYSVLNAMEQELTNIGGITFSKAPTKKVVLKITYPRAEQSK